MREKCLSTFSHIYSVNCQFIRKDKIMHSGMIIGNNVSNTVDMTGFFQFILQNSSPVLNIFSKEITLYSLPIFFSITFLVIIM